MSIAAARAAIEKNIRQVCAGSGRLAGDVKIIAVSKQQPDARIDDALASGQRLFGENRLQEAQARWKARRAAYPDLRLHMIGPLQTNKAGAAVALFDCIETVDRAALADVLVKEMKKQNRFPACFVQVNTGDESQKSGVAVDELPALLEHCRAAGLTISGLMCIPPQSDIPALHFALLKKLAERHGLKELSMGMSADYEQAAALGATYIRVGTAFFGEREG